MSDIRRLLCRLSRWCFAGFPRDTLESRFGGWSAGISGTWKMNAADVGVTRILTRCPFRVLDSLWRPPASMPFLLNKRAAHVSRGKIYFPLLWSGLASLTGLTNRSVRSSDPGFRRLAHRSPAAPHWAVLSLEPSLRAGLRSPGSAEKPRVGSVRRAPAETPDNSQPRGAF